jgi:hypothetical protein
MNILLWSVKIFWNKNNFFFGQELTPAMALYTGLPNYIGFYSYYLSQYQHNSMGKHHQNYVCQIGRGKQLHRFCAAAKNCRNRLFIRATTISFSTPYFYNSQIQSESMDKNCELYICEVGREMQLRRNHAAAQTGRNNNLISKKAILLSRLYLNNSQLQSKSMGNNCQIYIYETDSETQLRRNYAAAQTGRNNTFDSEKAILLSRL